MFEDLTLEQLRNLEREIVDEITTGKAKTKGVLIIKINLVARKTKRGKKMPRHEFELRLKDPDDFADQWEEGVQSFKRRFNKRKQWITADGASITPKQHNQRLNAGIAGDRIIMVDRWDDRAWGAIRDGLRPSASESQEVLDHFKPAKDVAAKRRELYRVRQEIARRELNEEYLKRWRSRVMEDTTEDALRRLPQKQLYARFGLKTADIVFAKRFKKGEISLDDVEARIRTYFKT